MHQVEHPMDGAMRLFYGGDAPPGLAVADVAASELPAPDQPDRDLPPPPPPPPPDRVREPDDRETIPVREPGRDPAQSAHASTTCSHCRSTWMHAARCSPGAATMANRQAAAPR